MPVSVGIEEAAPVSDVGGPPPGFTQDADYERAIDDRSNAEASDDNSESGDAGPEVVDPSEGEAAENGGFDPDAAARDDHDAVVEVLRQVIVDVRREIADLRAELNAVRRELRDRGEELRQALQLAPRHESDYQKLIALLNEMLEAGRGQSPDRGCQVMSKSQALKAETKLARKRWPDHAWDKIWDKLKTVLPRIWSMISHLLAVEEWKVSGQAGTGMFGLAQVGVEITFGR